MQKLSDALNMIGWAEVEEANVPCVHPLQLEAEE